MFRMCADDVGISLWDIRALTPVHDLYVLVKRATGLAEKLKKCVITPTGSRFTPALIDLIRDWLNLHLPDWASMRIEAYIEYLGMLLGQSAESQQWAKPTNKFQHRLIQRGHAHESMTQNILEHNARIQTILSYKLQFVDPPSLLVNRQDSIIAKIFRFPREAVPTWAGYHIDQLGFPRVAPIEGYGLSIMTRFVLSTCTSLPLRGRWRKSTLASFSPSAR